LIDIVEEILLSLSITLFSIFFTLNLAPVQLTSYCKQLMQLVCQKTKNTYVSVFIEKQKSDKQITIGTN